MNSPITFDGRDFRSYFSMYKYAAANFDVEISFTLFYQRVNRDWPLEKALFEQANRTYDPIPSVDHLGQTFPSQNAMFKHWGIPQGCAYRRLHSGWPLERTLTTPAMTGHRGNCHKCKDHLGKEWPSKQAMCTHYGITVGILTSRLKSNWPLMEALLTPVYAKGRGRPRKQVA